MLKIFTVSLVIIFLLIIGGNLLNQEESRPIKAQVPETMALTKHKDNPVIRPGEKGTFLRWPGDPCVLKDGKTYKMWFGSNYQEPDRTEIGYAESDDGIIWRPQPRPVLNVGKPGAADDGHIETPSVLKADTDGTYHLWYSARKSGENEVYQIAYATSPDGMQWTKHPLNPVIKSGDLYGWHGLGVLEPTVIREDDVYKMWFTGVGLDTKDGKTVRYTLGYTISMDGVHWQKNSPVMELSSFDSSKKLIVNSSFHVLKHAGSYELFYFGGDVPDVFATSPDGVSWQRRAIAPLPKGTSGTWDSTGIGSPSVIIDNGVYKMWYSGNKLEKFLGLVPYDFSFGIGYAVSK